jgi:hypothetical protein
MVLAVEIQIQEDIGVDGKITLISELQSGFESPHFLWKMKSLHGLLPASLVL